MEKPFIETFLPEMSKRIHENTVVLKNDPLSIAFNNILREACSIASCLDRIGVSVSQVLFESENDWIDRLKEKSPETFELYDEIVKRLSHLNDIIANYEKLKNENKGDVKKIYLNKRIVERLLDYVPDVKRQMTDILAPPENPSIKEFFEKIKNTYYEFMAKAKYIVSSLKEIDSSIFRCSLQFIILY